MEQQAAPTSRRELRERRDRRQAAEDRPRRRHRGTFRRRSYPLVTIVVSLAVAASAYAYRAAMLSGPNPVLDPRGVLHHALVGALLAVVVLAQGAQLRAAGRPGPAALVPWLVVGLPAVVEAVGVARTALEGSAVSATSIWLLEAPQYALVGIVALLAADGLRSTWTPLTLAFGATVLAGTAAAAVVAPTSVEALVGFQTPVLRCAVGGMTVCAALVASSHLPTGTRWTRAIGCAVPVTLLAVLPTVLTRPEALMPTQRWTIVVYPLGCLAAACLGVLLIGSGEVLERLRTRTAAA